MAQPSEKINMFVSRHPEDGGKYVLEAYWDTIQPGASLTSPDGTIFQSALDRQFIDVGNLTASELVSRFAGVWAIDDTVELPSGATTQRHQFTVSAAQLTTFAPTPTVVSPFENQVVPPRFSLQFGNGGNGWTIESGFPFEFIFPNPNREIHALLAPGETERVVTFRSNNLTYDDAEVIAISPNAARQFDVSLVQQSQSTLRTVTVVVPEPASIAIGCCAIIGLAAFRRRK
jgi:hypothetical protein